MAKIPSGEKYFGNPKTQLVGKKARQLRLQKAASKSPKAK